MKVQIKNKINKNNYNDLISWINSFDMPLCKNCTDINDLKDGNVFLELLINYIRLNRNKYYYSLLSSINNTVDSLEKIKLSFELMNKMINNNRINSRIEIFKNNINEFLMNEDLIIEFIIFIIYLYNNNNGKEITKNNNKIDLRNNPTKLDIIKSKNNSSDKIDKRKLLLNYYSMNNSKKIKDESSRNNKNNFLYYINEKNEKIINIDNNMNFLFSNGLTNLKAKQFYKQEKKEIKPYITKPKIIKYQSQYFNRRINYPYQSKKSNLIKEENKTNSEQNNQEYEINKNEILNNYMHQPPIFNNFKTKEINEDNNLEEENIEKYFNRINKLNINEKLKFLNNDNKNKNIFKSDKNNFKNKIDEENKEKDERKVNIFKMYENEKIRYKKMNVKNNKIKNNRKSFKKILINNIKPKQKDEKRRRNSFQINPQKIKNKGLNYSRNDIEKQIKKSNSYFIKPNYKIFEEIINNNNINKTELIGTREKEKIYNWLINLNIIKRENINIIKLPEVISDGVLLCNIINTFESKESQIIDILTDITIKENALININKALQHLNEIKDFPKNNISDNESIFEIDDNTIWGLLSDIYNYYSKKMNINLTPDYEKIGNSIKESNKSNEKVVSFNNEKSKIENLNLIFNDSNNRINKINNKKDISFKNVKYQKNYSQKNIKSYYSNIINKGYISNEEHINNFYKMNNLKKENPKIKNDERIESVRLVNNKRHEKNYFYYVNSLKSTLEQSRQQGKTLINNNINLSNDDYTRYSKNNDEYNIINNNNLYFNYSNNIYFNNNRKIRYSYNAINPDFYGTEYNSLQVNGNDFSE